MAQTLQAVFALNDRYTTVMTKIINSTDTAEKKVKDMEKVLGTYNKRLEQTKTSADIASGGIGGLATKIGGLVSAAYLGKKALEGMFAAVNLSAMQKVQETTFQALTHSEKIGSGLYDYVSRYAEVSALGREDVAQGVTAALTVTRDINQIEQFIRMIERLYAKDPSKGAQQAVFSLKELLAGDTVSARGVYGITGISGESIRSMMESGDTQGALDYISSIMDKFGATQEVVDKNFTGLITQTNIFTSNLKTAIGEAATPVMENLAGVMQRLNAEMQAGKYQPFINVMVNGMEMIGNGLAWVAQNADWLVPAIAGVMTALIIYNGVMKIVKATTELLAISTGILTGRWISAAAALAAFAGSAYVVSELTKDIDMETKQSLADIKSGLSSGLAGTADIDAHITNSDPIKVTGEVEIEQESLKYMMDFAGARFLAMYSTSMIQPQMIVENQTINQNADWDEGYQRFGDMIAEQNAAMPKGAYTPT
ncbi:hypothetical protein [Anaerotruncus rubiinfantis]|uniref:hypothetical protein n=1 Tax=Anaerotruncus rubiinfantis TaxID=1720200 RepID=UPI000831F3D8|nr:hypothetical protein [Anaerotruncus rubiinfantis]